MEDPEGHLFIRSPSVDYHVLVIRAVVFDFDGVILDTETADFISWQEFFVEHGLELSLEIWAQGVGTYPSTFDVYAHLASLSAREVEIETVRTFRRSRNDELIAIEVIRPGI